MKKRSDLERLLNDVLAEDEPALGRSDLLAQTLHQAQKKRQRRGLIRGGAGVSLLTALGVWLWPQDQLPRESADDGGFRLVVTAPLPANTTFETRSGLTPGFGSSPQEITFVETRAPVPIWQAIDDQQLLTLVDRPVALVRRDSAHAELIFSNPADRDQLLSQ